MALKIMISSSEDAIEFLDMMLHGHDFLSKRLEIMSKQQNLMIHQELERREYRISREEEVQSKEKALKIVGAK